MEAEALSNLLFVIRLGLVTVFLWVLSRIFDLWMAEHRRKEDRDAFIRAIYAEVDFNTFDMTRFLNATVALGTLEQLFGRNQDFVPHITDARHTEVYRSRISELHAVASDGGDGDSLVGSLVRFYGELEKVTQQIEGLSKESFKHISVAGKVATVANIYATCATCEAVGSTVLRDMEGKYAHLHLHRRVQDEHALVSRDNQTGEELAKRLEKLGSDLDRINLNRHQ